MLKVEESIPVSINLPTDASHQVKSVIAPPEPRSNAIDGGSKFYLLYFTTGDISHMSQLVVPPYYRLFIVHIVSRPCKCEYNTVGHVTIVAVGIMRSEMSAYMSLVPSYGSTAPAREPLPVVSTT